MNRQDDTRHTWRQWRTEGRGLACSNPPSRKSEVLIKLNRIANWAENVYYSYFNILISLKIAEFRTPTPQDVRKKGSKILKQPRFRNCFTFALTNKLVVIIDSLKVPKIKKILIYEIKFLVPNYSCLQNPWLGGYRPQIPVLSVLCPQLNLLNPPEKIPGYATGCNNHNLLIFQLAQHISEKHSSHRTYSQCLRVPDRRPATTWVHYTTCCNTQSCAPEDGQKNCPKHVEVIGISINCYCCI